MTIPKGSDYYCVGWVKWWCDKSKLEGDRHATVFTLNVGRVHDTYIHEKRRYLVFLSGNGEYKTDVPEEKTYHNLFELAFTTKMPKHIYTQFYAMFQRYFIPTTDEMLRTNIAQARLVTDSRMIGHAVTTLDAFDEIPEYNRYAF